MRLCSSSSKKKVDSANTPANSPDESDKKKRSPNGIFSFVGVFKEFTKKHFKRASPDEVHSPVTLKSFFSLSKSKAKKLASSLGLYRSKTTSGSEARSRDSPELNTSQEPGSSVDDTVPLISNTPPVQPLTNDESKASPPSDSSTLENPKELEPTPHFHQALLHMTDSPRKRFSVDIKSFSHELNAEGVRPFPLRKPHGSSSYEEVLNLIKTKFDKAKEEVNVDLKQFTESLVKFSEDSTKSHHELKVIAGELLILTQKCTNATSEEFWLKCEEIVEDLDKKHQEFPPGVPKQLHTRLLFILTRCTRLLQFRKEIWWQEKDFVKLIDSQVGRPKVVENGVATSDDMAAKLSHEHMSNHGEGSSFKCRICEEDVPTTYGENHSIICALVGRYDRKDVNVHAELEKVALTLDKIIENFTPKDSLKVVESPKRCLTSSASSMTPRSPILNPRPDLFELLKEGKVTLHDRDDIPQMTKLAEIARRAVNAMPDDDKPMKDLLSCLNDMRVTVDLRKFDMLTVETSGTWIEKLLREKYLELNENVDGDAEVSSKVTDIGRPQDRRLRRTRSVHLRDRISIEDFEEIKEISRGAFGRVLLARKRTTGDIFAIKVMKKEDMIRKNAVKSIFAERNILINVCNPFIVRFFYSFTSTENLYLVMEYLNGGDFFSLLKNMGCLEEPLARVYIAELVLALEYLHSENVVHRDLKPDNLLIAHDGHVKLTDFGLSQVGLINSSGDLSGPVLNEEKPKVPTSEPKSAAGTPDYLAPEVLLGTGHGGPADWWSVGIILFEFLVGRPPFNAGNPEQIFENTLNREIPWPRVPEDMSHEACDLIDRLLAKDPSQRLGARGAAEVKQHIFFKDINWDTLPEQTAPFVPDIKDAFDTSYFRSRYSNENGKSCENGNTGCFIKEGVDEPGGPAELETNGPEDNPFYGFSIKNLRQLTFINCNLVAKAREKIEKRQQDLCPNPK